jgi:hypothetical protein
MDNLLGKKNAALVQSVQHRYDIICSRVYWYINGRSSKHSRQPPSLQSASGSSNGVSGGTITCWGHLLPVQVDAENGLTVNGMPASYHKALKLWRMATLDRSNREWQQDPKGVCNHTLLPSVSARLKIYSTPTFWSNG